MRVLITVGSTRFDALVEAALSQPVLNALTRKGYSDVVVQCGNSQVDDVFSPTERERNVRRYGVNIVVWRFKPSLDEEYDAADLVIGHAGSGTILDVLRRGKPLIIVPNPTLLDNHQEDMAHAMGKLGHAMVSTVNELAQSIMDLDRSILVPFPQFDGGKFRRLVDREMGTVFIIPLHKVRAPSEEKLPPPMPPEVTATVVDDNPEAYEERHVHVVYDHIASHFSSTRYKPWPLVSEFLQNIPTGWVGLDSGTGNGKYLGLPTNHPGKIWTIGLDRSQSLLDLARNAGGTDKMCEVVRGDVLENVWRRGAFDYAISIATIHHLATAERRAAGVKRLLESVSPRHGRILIYVWATKQDEQSKRIIPVSAREGLYADADGERYSSGHGQDVFVPWVLSSDNARPKVPRTEQSQNVPPDAIRRYYHMFSKDELRGLVQSAAQELGLKVGPPPLNEAEVKGTEGVEIVVSGWERSNYYIELRRWQR